MNKFLKKGLLFLLILAATAYVLNYMADKGLRMDQGGEYGIWNKIFEGKINADLLIVGSSRAEVQISPLVLDSILHVNSFNLGLEGYTFPLPYTRFRVCNEYNKLPKYVIYSLDMATLGNNDALFNSTQFIPYLGDTMLQNATGDKRYVNHFSKLDFYIPLLKYKSHYAAFKKGITDFLLHPHTFKETREKGYFAKPEAWDGSFESFVAAHKDHIETQTTDSGTILQFREFLAFCKANSIKVALVYSPDYRPVQKYYSNRKEIINLYDSLAREYGDTFLDYSNDSLGTHREYFYNSQHMNHKGAELFSKELATDLKPWMARYR